VTTTCLYRHFNEAGVLLCVGISLDAVRRIAQHREKPWFDEITRIEVRRFPSRDAAESAEALAIMREEPRHNRRVIARLLPKEPEGCAMFCPTTANIASKLLALTTSELKAVSRTTGVSERALWKIRAGKTESARDWVKEVVTLAADAILKEKSK